MRARRRRELDRPCPQRPSHRAEERLRAAVTRDVADLRLQLEEASLRSDALLWAGHPEAAAEVVDEKRELVSRFESRLRQRLSEAAVEAEAERVLAAAPGAAVLSDEPAQPPAGRLSPALLSALAAAVLAVLAVNGPVPGSGELASADGTAPPTGGHEIVALPDDPRSDPTSPPARLAPVAPESRPERNSRVAQRHPADLPDASPTERLVGMLQVLVDAADHAVRDALRALLAETGEPPVQPSGEAPEAEPVEDRPSEPEVAAEETGDPSDEGTEQSEDGGDGDLPSVSGPLDVSGEDGEHDDPEGERPAER